MKVSRSTSFLFLLITLASCTPTVSRAGCSGAATGGRAHGGGLVAWTECGLTTPIWLRRQRSIDSPLRGVRGKLVPPFPSQTFPSHATLATGVGPARHGIVSNRFWDAERGAFALEDDVSWYRMPPVWIVARQQRQRAFVYHWPASAGAYEGIEPDRWVPFDKATRDKTRLNTLLDWVALPGYERPHLAMTYLAGCDHEGHAHGPLSAEVRACVVRVDRMLGEALRRLDPERTTLFVVSDHGMASSYGTVNVQSVLEAAPQARIVASGPIANIYFKRQADIAPAQAAAMKLPHLRVFTADQADAELGYRAKGRTGDLILVAESGWQILTKGSAVTGPPRSRGQHGDQITNPTMAANLLRLGPRDRAGSQPRRTPRPRPSAHHLRTPRPHPTRSRRRPTRC